MNTFLNIKTVYRTDYTNAKLKIKLLPAFRSKNPKRSKNISINSQV